MTDLRQEFAIRSGRLNKHLHDNDDKQSSPECQVPAELIDYRDVALIFIQSSTAAPRQQGNC